MKLGDLVMEKEPPFLIKGADYGLEHCERRGDREG